MSDKISILADSIRQILHRRRNDEFAGLFYDKLMARDDQIKVLFSETNFAQQRHKLFFALMMVIEHIEQPGMYKGVMDDLGKRHVEQYGVTPDMLPHFKAAMLETLPEVLGNDWNEPLHIAWSDAMDEALTLICPENYIRS